MGCVCRSREWHTLFFLLKRNEREANEHLQPQGMAKRHNNSGIPVFFCRGDSRKTRRLQRQRLVLG